MNVWTKYCCFRYQSKKASSIQSFNKISTSELTCVSYDPQNRGFELFAAVAGSLKDIVQ
jgi:hypothetical protein